MRCINDLSDQKVVVKLSVHDEKGKQKAMKAVSGLSGIETLALDTGDQKLTITWDVDPIDVVAKLRKNWYTEIVSVGAPEKKKEENKKDEAKKENEKEDGNDKKKTEAEEIDDLIRASKKYYPYNPCFQHYYCVPQPENPFTCVIC
ncbi:unnamed protein product [Rhodiola kirilowii]